MIILKVFINIEELNQQELNTDFFVIRIKENNNVKLQIYCLCQDQTVYYTISNITVFYPNIVLNTYGWHQVIINKQNSQTLVKICDYSQCEECMIDYLINPSTIDVFSDQGESWVGQAYGITFYKGIGLYNFYIIQNIVQPEVMIDLNIQEKIQSNVTKDYSQYQFIAKLGEYFNWDQYDPFLFDSSLLFNSSQFIYIKDPQLKETYTVEFKIIVSSIFTSNIVLLNYTYLNQYSLQIFLNQDFTINVMVNEVNSIYNLIIKQVIHFSIGIIHKLDKNQNYFQICFIQFDNQDAINQIFPNNIFSYQVSPTPFVSGRGDLFIGSNQNQFDQDQYFQLLQFRLYQGFFYDNEGIIEQQCQFYLNDRCIICKNGYVLQTDHTCKITCSSQTFLTKLFPTHNQCLRVCHPNCSNCNAKFPEICLQCDGIRLNPPVCRCPAGYFEDGVSPNCIKYYPQIQFQSGLINLQVFDGNYQEIFYYQPYTSIPNVDVIYQKSQYNSSVNYDLFIQIESINTQSFTVYYDIYCPDYEYITLQWISSIGNDNFNVIPFYNAQGQTTIPPPQIINYTQQNGFFHIQNFMRYTNQIEFQIDKISLTEINIFGQINKLNLLQTNYVFYEYSNIDRDFADIELDQIPKSIPAINLINGIFSQGTSGFNFIQIQRNLTHIKIQNTYQSINLKGVLLFATQQCYDQLDSCDFYESYITSCSLEYSFCKCDEVGYFVNSTNQCQKCNQNCRTCSTQQLQCTSCHEKLFLDDTSNQCVDCHPSCQTCSGQLMSQCLTCSKNRFIFQNSECICLPQYYENGVNCELCSPRCYECDNFSSCLSCPQGRYLDKTTNSCLCPLGQFELPNFECLDCNPTCKTCNNILTCLSCSLNRQLQNNRCVCIEGYYQDGQDCLSCENILGLNNKYCKIKNCFDGIWTPNEQCDDNNQINRDGCSNCMIDPQYYCLNRVNQKSQCFKCQDNCHKCSVQTNKIMCDTCYEGYFSHQNQCIKCSKLCLTCQNVSTQCLTCIIKQQLPDLNFKCQGCDNGYYIYEDLCNSICGDGIKVLEEDCDDGNLLLGDGCDQKCKIEVGFHCDFTDLASLCYKIEQPSIIITRFLQSSNSVYFVQLQSSQLVTYNNISLQIKSDQINESFHFNYQYQESEQNFKIMQINVTITFNTSVDFTFLTFSLFGEVFNHQGIKLVKNSLQKQFQNLLVLSEAQNKSSAQVSSSVSTQMIITLTFNCLSIIMTGSAQLSMMLRVNTILTYIKYIDINIPPNLMELLLQLEQFNLIKKIDILQAYNNIQFGPQMEFEYIYPGEQFNKHGINANFIPNILPFILNLLAGYLFIQILQIQVILLRKIMNHKKKTIQSISSLFYRTIVFYHVYALRLIQEFKKKGKQQLIESSQYSIIFSIFLQIRYQQFRNVNQIINFIVSIGFLLYYLWFTYVRIISKDQQLRYQGFKPFNFSRALNPIIYIFSIVFLQSFQLWQLIMIQTTSMILILSLIKQPFISIYLNIQNLLEEVSLLLIFTSFLLFIYNPAQFDYITIGFVQQGLIVFILSANILIQGQINLCFIKQIYRKHQLKLK